MDPATRGATVVLAGLGLTVSLGSLFLLIPVAAELIRPIASGGRDGWSVGQLSLVFAIGCASFVVAMTVGGVLQDRVGPRWSSTAGGVLVGLGMILASLSQARIGSSGGFAPLMVAGLGLMVGCGAGLTFASAVPPGVQWLVPKRRGLVIGLVVAGMSLGPAWLNGSAVQFVRARGVDSVLFVQGIALLAVIVSLSQFIDGPLPGYVPPGSYSEATGMVPDVLRWSGMSSRQTLGSRAFRVLWTRTALLGAAVAMLLVRALPVMARAFPSQPALWGCVAGVVGGLAAGLLHDRVGEPGSYVVFVVLLIAVSGGGVLLAAGYATAAFVVSAAAWSGGLVSVWISTIDSFGLRRAGANFGLVFTGWCVGVLLGALAIVGFATGMPVHLGFVGPETGMALAFAVVLASAALMGLRVRVPVELPAHEEDRPR